MDFVHVTLAMDDRAREACHDLFDVDGGCTAAVLGSIESLDAAVYHWLPTNHFTDRSSGSTFRKGLAAAMRRLNLGLDAVRLLQ